MHMSGIYSKDALTAKGIPMSNPAEAGAEEAFAIVQIINCSDVCVFLPCQATNGMSIYFPSKLELYENVPDSIGRIVMVDCFLCNKFLMLKPSDSISLCSDIASLGACENTGISEVVFYYPYACDATGKTVDFFKIRAGLAGCDLKTSASFHPVCKQ